MQINGLQHAQAAQSLTGTSRSAGAQRSAPTAQPQSTFAADELDLSPEAQSLGSVQGTAEASSGGIRWDKVNALRDAIASGNYETPERLSSALDNMLDAFA
ncbi:MAG: flagellar biosynthesis anti-sigma factor FlgM [Aureliella sp.]